MTPDADAPFNERLLPPLLKRIVRAVGLPAALRLLKARGGTRYCVPVSPTGLILEFMDSRQATALIRELGATEHVSLPKADKALLELRNAQIRLEYAAGDSLLTLALRYNLTTRHVLNIVRGTDREEDEAADLEQGDLFGG